MEIGPRRLRRRSTKVRSFVNKIRMIWLVVSVVLVVHLMDDKHLNIVVLITQTQRRTANAYAKNAFGYCCLPGGGWGWRWSNGLVTKSSGFRLDKPMCFFQHLTFNQSAIVNFPSDIHI